MFSCTWLLQQPAATLLADTIFWRRNWKQKFCLVSVHCHAHRFSLLLYCRRFVQYGMKFLLSSKFSRNPGNMSKTYTHVLSTWGKYMAKAVFPASEHEYTAAGGEVQVPYFRDHKAHRIIRRSIKNWMLAVFFIYKAHEIIRRSKWSKTFVSQTVFNSFRTTPECRSRHLVLICHYIRGSFICHTCLIR